MVIFLYLMYTPYSEQHHDQSESEAVRNRLPKTDPKILNRISYIYNDWRI